MGSQRGSRAFHPREPPDAALCARIPCRNRRVACSRERPRLCAVPVRPPAVGMAPGTPMRAVLALGPRLRQAGPHVGTRSGRGGHGSRSPEGPTDASGGRSIHRLIRLRTLTSLVKWRITVPRRAHAGKRRRRLNCGGHPLSARGDGRPFGEQPCPPWSEPALCRTGVRREPSGPSARTDSDRRCG